MNNVHKTTVSATQILTSGQCWPMIERIDSTNFLSYIDARIFRSWNSANSKVDGESERGWRDVESLTGVMVHVAEVKSFCTSVVALSQHLLEGGKRNTDRHRTTQTSS